MPLTIWKIELKLIDIQEITVPEGSEFLSAREQSNKICVWFRCDPLREKIGVKIAIAGTGYPAPSDGQFLGTASLEGGKLMFHVFARIDVH